MGFNVFGSLRKDNPCVDIRQYWKPPNHNDVIPTRRGLCQKPVEYNHLKTSWEDILKNLPEMETFVLCYDRNDQLNQMGLLQCPKSWPRLSLLCDLNKLKKNIETFYFVLQIL